MRLAGLILAAALAAGPAAAQTAADHIAMARSAAEARDPATALQHYQAAIALDSNNYEANWRGAIALIDMGKQIPDSIKSPHRDSLYAEAERWARRAVAADSMGADGHFALADAVGRASLTKSTKERIKRATEIRNEALRAIELNPQHDGAYHILGRWNAEIMRLSGLSRFFAKSFLGAGIFNEASWDRAISNMEKAVELNPARIYHHLDLAEVYIDRDRYSDARAQLEQVAGLPVADVMDPVYKEQGAALLRKIEGKKDKGN
ncbi:MAG TPA: tetratricopeptide repeat protein [Gemmatimonadales bacterium]|nr:tetratricopeptide repeat protein [Gemmatimonadales bacterium]